MYFKKYLFQVALCVVGVFAAYAYVFSLQMGAPLKAEYWIRNEKILKTSLAEKISQPKILIVSGSNSLFGIESPVIEQLTCFPVVNMALHAGLPLDWILDYAESNAVAGDVVVLPLEWLYYLRNFEYPSEWWMTQAVSWDPSYFDSLGVIRKIKFISSMSFSEMLKNIEIKHRTNEVLKENPDRVLPTRSMVLDQYSKQLPAPTIYHFLNIDQHGDINNTCVPPNREIVFEDYEISGVGDTREVRREAIDAIAAARTRLLKRGVKMYLAVQPMARTPITSSPEFRKSVGRIQAAIIKAGLPLLGNSDQYYFDKSDFFDTPFHLNCFSRKVRSEILGRQLAEVLGHP